MSIPPIVTDTDKSYFKEQAKEATIIPPSVSQKTLDMFRESMVLYKSAQNRQRI
jgi:hypothetical protein